MLGHFSSAGHAISGYLLATALGGDHRDPIMPDLPVLVRPITLDEFDPPAVLPQSADPNPPKLTAD